MRRTAASIILLPAIPLLCSAQTIVLKSGQTVAAESVRRSGDLVMARVSVGTAGSGEIGHGVNTIARIEFPRPPALDAAAKLKAEGKLKEALASIDPAVTASAPFRDIAGNWFGRSALLRASLLLALNRTADSIAQLDAIPATKSDPELSDLVQVARAQVQLQTGSVEEAQKTLDALLSTSRNAAVLSEAWVAKGTAFFSRENYEEALIAYLHVTVLHSESGASEAAALLGAARSAAKLGDSEQSAGSIRQLLSRHPDSSEARLAATEFPELASPQPLPSNNP